MKFRSNAHCTAFTEAIKDLRRSDYAELAAVYSLTADGRLWNQVKHCVRRNEILFDQMRPIGGTTNSYALLCVARDLYLGTTHITLGELADPELIPPKLFGVICIAVAIRRYGLEAIHVQPGRKTGRKEKSE